MVSLWRRVTMHACVTRAHVRTPQAFFFVCVWVVPFGFCLSLSVTDNVLPGNAGACACHAAALCPVATHVCTVLQDAPYALHSM